MKQRPSYIAECLARDLEVDFVAKDRGNSTINHLNIISTGDIKKKYDFLWISYGGASDWINKVEYDKLIYDNLDDFPVYDSGDEILAKRADIIFCSSLRLFHHKRLRYGDKVYYLPNACSPKDLDRSRFDKAKVSDIIYVGAMAYWLDYDLINEIVKIFKDYKFVFVGPEYGFHWKPESSNVELTGYKDRIEAFSYVMSSKVAILPFKMNDRITEAADPIKIYEYLYCGRPVVASNIYEMSKWDNRYIYKAVTIDDWMYGIYKFLKMKINRKDLIDYVKNNTWEDRYKVIKEVLCI